MVESLLFYRSWSRILSWWKNYSEPERVKNFGPEPVKNGPAPVKNGPSPQHCPDLHCEKQLDPDPEKRMLIHTPGPLYRVGGGG